MGLAFCTALMHTSLPNSRLAVLSPVVAWGATSQPRCAGGSHACHDVRSNRILAEPIPAFSPRIVLATRGAGSSDDDTFYDRTTKAKPGAAGGGGKKGKAGSSAKQEVGGLAVSGWAKAGAVGGWAMAGLLHVCCVCCAAGREGQGRWRRQAGGAPEGWAL